MPWHVQRWVSLQGSQADLLQKRQEVMRKLEEFPGMLKIHFKKMFSHNFAQGFHLNGLVV